MTVTSKELFLLFGEAAPVFDVFIPRVLQKGSSRGFAFVRFKIEWDANKAMEKLHGCQMGDRKINIQMAQHDHGRQNKRLLTRNLYTVPIAQQTRKGLLSNRSQPATCKVFEPIVCGLANSLSLATRLSP